MDAEEENIAIDRWVYVGRTGSKSRGGGFENDRWNVHAASTEEGGCSLVV